MTDRSIVRKQVTQYIEQAEAFYGRSFPRPVIKYSNRMTRALGVCEYFPLTHDYTLKFAVKFMDTNTPEQYGKVVAHEVAHMVQRELEGYTGHDRGFMRIMTNCFEMPELGGMYAKGLQTHNQHRKKIRFNYRCPDCKAIMGLSTRRHNQVLKGSTFNHTGCTGNIEFTNTKVVS